MGACAANRVPGKREAHGPDAGARASERRAGIINRQQRRVTHHRQREVGPTRLMRAMMAIGRVALAALPTPVVVNQIARDAEQERAQLVGVAQWLMAHG